MCKYFEVFSLSTSLSNVIGSVSDTQFQNVILCFNFQNIIHGARPELISPIFYNCDLYF